MYISETRRQKEIEKILASYFENQTEPTLREITNYINKLDTEVNLDKPIASPGIYKIERGEESSASKENNWLTSVGEDIEVAYSNLEVNAVESDSVFNDHYSQLKTLLSKLTKDESRLSALISMVGLSGGYNKVIDDPLVNLSNVDTTQTTCDIDVSSSSATISENLSLNEDDLSISSIYSPLAGAAVTTSVLNTQNLRNVNVIGDSSPSWILRDVTKPWLQEIITYKDEPVVVEVKIDFKELVSPLSKLVFKKNFPAERGNATMSVLYSKNGYEWLPVPSIANEFNLVNNTVVSFTPIEARFIKLLITKYYSDKVLSGTGYAYYVGADIVTFYLSSYSEDEGNIFQTLPLEILDEDSNALGITKCSVEVCDTTDTDNTIDYYISYDSGETFLPISPFTEQNPLHPTVIFASSIYSSLTKDIYLPTDTQLDDYRYAGKTNKYNLPLGLDEDGIPLDLTGVLEDELEIYRNIGTKGKHESNDYPTAYAVSPSVEMADITNFAYSYQGKWIPKGWNFDGVYYSTIASIRYGIPITVDFGPKAAIVDGIKVSGKYSFQSGDHLVQIYPENFSRVFLVDDISSPVEETGRYEENVMEYIDSLEQSSNSRYTGFRDRSNGLFYDPLYPYNHRLLIEGIPYTDSFTSDRIYRGVDLFAALKVARTSQLDFENNILDTDLRKFYILTGAEHYDTDEGNYVAIGVAIVKRPDEIIVDGDRSRENFALYIKTYDEEKYTANTITFRAELHSRNDSTPIFSGYRLKLGTVANEG